MPITPEATAKMLFPAENEREADNHRNTGEEVFMKWLERQLLPAFRENYGEKKIILILDSPPYHHAEW